MSDSPEVVVRFDEDGAKATLQAVDATDKQLRKLNKQLINMSDRADMATLQAQSELYQEQVTRLKTAQDALAESMKKEVTVADKINDQLKEMTANTALLKAQATSPEFASASRAQKEAQDALTASMEKEITAADKVNDQLKEMTANTELLKVQAASPEFAAAAKAQKAAQDALTDTMREEVTVADKLNDQIIEMADNTRLLAAQSASPEFAAAAKAQKAAQDALTASIEEQVSAFDKIASGANKINEIFEAAGRAVGIAKDLGAAAAEMAQTGAAASDIGQAFEKLGDAAPGLAALQTASASVVDATALQGFANLASEIGASKEEMEGAAQRMAVLADEHGRLGETSDFMTKLVKGEVEGLRELGIVVDLSAKEFEGLTEAEKKLAVFQQQAALGSQEQVDAMDSAQAAILRQSTAMGDLQSEAEVAFAEFVIGSGVLDMVGDAIDFVSGFVKDNAALFEQLGEIAKTVASITGKVLAPAIERVAIVFELATDLLGPLLDGLEVLVDANNALMDLIPDLDDVATTFFITDMPTFTTNQDALNESVKSFAQRSLEAAQALRREQKAAEDTAAAVAAIGTRFHDRGVARQKSIKLAFEEVDAMLGVLKGTTDQSEALDILIDRYGETESAVAALNSGLRLVEAGASAAQQQLQAAGEGELADKFRAQRDELNATAGAIHNMTSALQKQLDGATTVKDAENELTESIKAGNEAREKRIDLDRERLEFDQQITAMMIDVETQEAEAFILQQQRQEELFESYTTMTAAVVAFYDAVALGVETERIASEELAFAAEAEAGMMALGNATVFSADKLGGWGAEAGAVMSASIGLAKGLKESASGADSFNAVLSAGEAVSKGAIKDETSLAVVLGSMAAARSAMAFAGGNFVGGLGYAGASAQFFATAAMGGGGGGGGGGAGATTDAAQAPTAADVFEQPEAAQQGGGGGTIIYNIQSFNPDGTGEAIINHINEFAEAAGGGQIHPSLIGTGQGRSGP